MKKRLSDFETIVGMYIIDDQNYFGIILHALKRQGIIYFLVGYNGGITELKLPEKIKLLSKEEFEKSINAGCTGLFFSQLRIGSQFTVKNKCFRDRFKTFVVEDIDESGYVYYYDVINENEVYKKIGIEHTVSLEC